MDTYTGRQSTEDTEQYHVMSSGEGKARFAGGDQAFSAHDVAMMMPVACESR